MICHNKLHRCHRQSVLLCSDSRFQSRVEFPLDRYSEPSSVVALYNAVFTNQVNVDVDEFSGLDFTALDIGRSTSHS